jgi:hypothetical protein
MSKHESARRAHEESDAREEQLVALEREMLVDAYVRGDEDVRVVDGQWVVAEIDGVVEPVRAPLAEIEKEISKRGRGRRISGTSAAKHHVQEDSDASGSGSDEGQPVERVLDMMDTHIMTIHIVRPQVSQSTYALRLSQMTTDAFDRTLA